MRKAFVERLMSLAQQDPRIILLTGDLGFGVLDGFAKAFPKQYLNVGVAEQNMTGIAAGLAMEGYTVFTYSIANFPTLRCLEQIRNDVCYHHANVKVVAIGGGFSYGALGFSHHATEDLSILRSLSHMMVVAPGDDWEAAEATAALASTPGPGYLRLDRSSAGNTFRPGEQFVLGRGRVLREGTDCCLMTTGGILGTVLEAAARLAECNVTCRVVNMHTVKPLDRALIVAAAKETGGIITIEEHTLDGGFGSAVAEVCVDEQCVPPIFHRIGLRNEVAMVAGEQEYLRKHFGLDATSMVQTVRQVLGQRARPVRVASTIPT